MKIVGGKDYLSEVKELIYYYNPMDDVIYMCKTL